MSLSKAQSWLKNHSDSIPALNINYLNIKDILASEKNFQAIVTHAMNDPGLSLALLKKVNTNRGSNTGKDLVESTSSAISLLGNKVTHKLLLEYKIAEKTLTNPHQLFLFHQIINRSFHNRTQVTRIAEENGYQHVEQLQACALLAYIGEAVCCVHDFENYLKYIMAGSVIGEELKFFGFSFSQLTESICIKANLPEIFILSLPHKNSDKQRERFLYFISILSHQCDHGWYTDRQLDTFTQFSEFLQKPVDLVIEDFHQFSVQAARQSILQEAWQPASRLILLSDKAWKPAVSIETLKPQNKESQNSIKVDKTIRQKSTQSTPVKKPASTAESDIFNHIKQLLHQKKTTKSDILNACIDGLSKDLKMTKVSLLLLSQDKTKLSNRMSRGVEKDSSFARYNIDMSKSGLLQILLKKPQAVWINQITFKKYQKLIPSSFLASIMTNDFLAMSLFIGSKPVGIVYADRTNTNIKLDEEAFNQFKKLITLSSKALTFLSTKH